jgi:hypothetical protein
MLLLPVCLPETRFGNPHALIHSRIGISNEEAEHWQAAYGMVFEYCSRFQDTKECNLSLTWHVPQPLSAHFQLKGVIFIEFVRLDQSNPYTIHCVLPSSDCRLRAE